MAEPEFAENVRARLVNPRRNNARAINHLTDGKQGRNVAALEGCLQVKGQLDALAEYVDRENARHEHVCSCGHIHYVQGDEV